MSLEQGLNCVRLILENKGAKLCSLGTVYALHTVRVYVTYRVRLSHRVDRSLGEGII